jgi:hypothetical protein
MRVAILVYLPGPHRLPFEAVWEGDELPTPAQVTKAMRDDKLVGTGGERVTWDNAHGVLVMSAHGEAPSGARSTVCHQCRTGRIILAPMETEGGAVKWEGSCPRCGNDVTIDERDL